MWSATPKFETNEPKPLTTEQKISAKVNERSFWYYQNVRFFEKNGEEWLGFGHGDVKNLREYLREIKQGGDDSEYLALLEFIKVSRGSGRYRREEEFYNLDEVTTEAKNFQRAEEIKEFFADDKLAVDPGDLVNMDKNIQFLIDGIGLNEHMASYSAIKKVSDLIDSWRIILDQSGKDRGEVPGAERFLGEFLKKYFSKIDGEKARFDDSNPLQKKEFDFDRDYFVGLLARCRGYYAGTVRFAEEMADDFLGQSPYYRYHRFRRDFLTPFFNLTSKYLKLAVDGGYFDSSMGAEAREKVLGAFKTINDPEERLAAAKKIAGAMGADVFLSHFYEFNLPKFQEEELLEVLAEADPESVLHHARYIDFRDLSNRHEVFFELMFNSTDLFWRFLDDLEIDGDELTELLNFAVQKRPMQLLANFDQIAARLKEPALISELLAKIKKYFGEVAYTDVEILNELTDACCSDTPEARGLVSPVKEAAIINLTGLLMKQYPDSKAVLAANREELQEKLTKLGLKTAFRDVINYFYANYNEATSRLIDYDADSAKDKPMPISDEAIRLVWKKILGREEKGVYFLYDLLKLYRFESPTAADKALIKEVIDKVLEGVFEDGVYISFNYFDAYKDGLINSDEFQAGLDKVIEGAPANLLDKESYVALRRTLSERQKIRLLEKLSENDPWLIVQNFWRLRLDNGQKELDTVRRFMAEGRQPFTRFETPQEAIKILSMMTLSQVWPENCPAEEIPSKIKHAGELRREIDPAVMKIFNHEYFSANIDIGSFSLEQLRLIGIFQKKYPAAMAGLQKGLEENHRYDEWLVCFLAVQSEKDLPRLAELVEEALAEEKKNDLAARRAEKRKGNVGERVFLKKFFPYPEKHNQGIALALLLRLPYKQALARIDRMVTVLRDEKKSTEKGKPIYYARAEDILGFVFENSPEKRDFDFSARFEFLEKRGPELARWLNFLGDDACRNLDDTIYSVYELGSPASAYFLNHVDWGKIVSGYEKISVIRLYLKYCREGLLKVEDARDTKNYRDFLAEFGVFDSILIFKNYLALKRGMLADDSLRRLGVVSSGKEGEVQLRQGFRALRDKFIMNGEFNVEDWDLQNPAVVEILKNFSDFEAAEWRDARGFKEKAESFAAAEESGEIKPLEAGFKKQEIKVSKLVDFDKENVSVSQSAQERFRVIFSGIDQFFTGRTDVEAASVVHFLIKSIDEEIEQFTEKIDEFENAELSESERQKRTSSLRDQLRLALALKEALEKINDMDEILRRLINFEIASAKKKDNPITTPAIRALVFARAASDRREYADKLTEWRMAGLLQKHDLEEAVEFINNIVKQHTYHLLNLDDRQQKHLSKIFNINEIKTEISRLNEMISGKKSSLLCVPSRGLLGELSGHYADACWATQENIMKKNPAMTAVAFVSNPDDTVIRRLAGATLLIETSVAGKKALVLRGVNPKQNFVTRMNAESFFNALVDDYLAPICRERGIELILLPVYNGGALTNRPSLDVYMKEKYGQLDRVRPDERIDFNGYDITGDCVVIRQLVP